MRLSHIKNSMALSAMTISSPFITKLFDIIFIFIIYTSSHLFFKTLKPRLIKIQRLALFFPLHVKDSFLPSCHLSSISHCWLLSFLNLLCPLPPMFVWSFDFSPICQMYCLSLLWILISLCTYLKCRQGITEILID